MSLTFRDNNPIGFSSFVSTCLVALEFVHDIIFNQVLIQHTDCFLQAVLVADIKYFYKFCSIRFEESSVYVLFQIGQ